MKKAQQVASLPAKALARGGANAHRPVLFRFMTAALETPSSLWVSVAPAVSEAIADKHL
jgi:hypothetical protein